MSVETLLAGLRSYRQAVAVKEVPAREPEYASPDPPLPPPLAGYLERRGIRLYRHQVEVLAHLRRGRDVVLTTPTASGKTLAFSLPVLEHLHRHPAATALYLYPMKALAYDQLASLRELAEETGIPAGPAVYDGDTPRAERPRIRRSSRLVLTNPHALHRYLQWHHLWARFFAGLAFVVLDEAHWYRGVFGSHVACVVRRLLRVLEHYGSRPRLVVSSATMADPAEHARRLTGRDCTPVDADGSARGRRFFLFWNTALYPEVSPHRQAAELLSFFVRAGLQTLCFAPSRRTAEFYARWAAAAAGGTEVAAYRAGYLPEERRSIERRLKEGGLRGVAATNALELGVDIGGLDAVIVAGYPGTVASFRQQAGRAGRAGQDALVAFVAFDDPLNQYFARHPDRLLGRVTEQAVVNTENDYVLRQHVLCAAAELPLGEEDAAWFGPRLPETARELAAAGSLAPLALPGGRTRWAYRGPEAPALAVSLDAFGEGLVRLVHRGRVVEHLDRRRACLEAHPGAVYLHQGEAYVVWSLDLEGGRAELEHLPDADYYTTALTRTELRVDRVLASRAGLPYGLALGRVAVKEVVTGYAVKKYDRVAGVHELVLPPLEFDTTAVWVHLPETPDSAACRQGDWEGGLHAAEHALIAAAPLLAMCDRWDVGGLSTPWHPATGGPTV
ncbi:MAG: DEAD/DEAH box helicase, partial [Firmicutes bacterium]|nr:DEAD/DEAH box helicase [Bacillota bacterium]